MADGLFNPSRLYEVLAAQGLLPQVAVQPSPVSFGPAYQPAFNNLFTGWNPKRSTIAHEMTHAVQDNVLKATAEALEKKSKKTQQETQFLNAYRKLMAPDGMVKDSRRTQADKAAFDKTAAALYGKPVESRYDKYRTSPSETQAWGVGSYSDLSYDDEDRIPHMDASYTTEFAILLSMYDKLPQELKQMSATQRKEDLTRSKDFFRKQKQEIENSTEFSNLLSDPFARTIK